MKGLVFLMCLALGAQAPPKPTPTPAAAPPKQTHQERRAEILRTMQELRAKLQALELELQLIEEERQNAPAEAAAPAQTGWRETTRPDGRKDVEAVKKARPQCQAFTSNGKRCTRSAETGSKYCWQHRH